MSASLLSVSAQLPPLPSAVGELSSLESVIHPQRRLLAALARHRRLDGRSLSSARACRVSVCELLHCESAAVASSGGSSLLCGCRLEVAPPLTAAPHCGFLSVDCHLTPLCSVDSADFTFGRASSLSAALSAQLLSLLRRSVPLSQLSIRPATAAWMLHVDVVVTSNDGALLDCAVLAAQTAIAALTVPEFEVSDTGEVLLLEGGPTPGRPLVVHGRTVCSTFAAVGRHLLLDPSSTELQLSDATLTVSVGSDGRLVDVWKAGGAVLSRDEVEQCIALAKQRSAQQLEAIERALQTHTQRSHKSDSFGG